MRIKQFLILVLAAVLMVVPITVTGNDTNRPNRVVITDEAGEILLTDEHIADAFISLLPFGHDFEPVVNITFTTDGTELFAQATAANIGRMLRIYVEGELVSAATVLTIVAEGQTVISGNFTTAQAAEMARSIRGYEPIQVSEEPDNFFITLLQRIIQRILR